MFKKTVILEKLKAFSLHFLLSALVATVCAYVVYVLWYPSHYAAMVHGAKIFLIVLGVELVLGPVMSLVIYNSKKRKVELIRDYFVIGTFQVLALVYGLYSVVLSRPVYEVFVQDRLQVVVATQFLKKDLLFSDDYKLLPWGGPLRVCTERPSDLKEREDLLFAAVSGRDIHMQPRYYRPCKNKEVFLGAYKSSQLEEKTPLKLEQIPEKFRQSSFKWLPVINRFGAWLAIFPNENPEDIQYLDLFPFDE